MEEKDFKNLGDEISKLDKEQDDYEKNYYKRLKDFIIPWFDYYHSHYHNYNDCSSKGKFSFPNCKGNVIHPKHCKGNEKELISQKNPKFLMGI